MLHDSAIIPLQTIAVTFERHNISQPMLQSAGTMSPTWCLCVVNFAYALLPIALWGVTS
jgi:hypothetical protein